MAVAKFLIKYGQSSRVYGKANRIYGNSITLKPRVFHSVKELREGRKSIENIKCSGRSSINRLDILTKKFVNLRSTITMSQFSPRFSLIYSLIIVFFPPFLFFFFFFNFSYKRGYSSFLKFELISSISRLIRQKTCVR